MNRKVACVLAAKELNLMFKYYNIKNTTFLSAPYGLDLHATSDAVVNPAILNAKLTPQLD